MLAFYDRYAPTWDDRFGGEPSAELFHRGRFKSFEQATRRPQENPFAGLTHTLMAGFCLISAVILVAFKGPWPVWGGLFVIALVLALRRR